MTTLRVSLQEVVQGYLQKEGVRSCDVSRVSVELDGVSLTIGGARSTKGALTMDYEQTYPVLCMDCKQSTDQASTCKGSTGLCGPCLAIRERRNEEQDQREIDRALDRP